MDDTVIPVGVAARRLNLSPQRVRQLIDEGKLGSVQRGAYNMRLIPRASVEKLAEQRRKARGTRAAR